MTPRMSGLRRRVAGAVRSRTGHDLLLYLFFVAVAFMLWILMSMDNEVQRDFEIPLELTDVPDSVVIIGTLPERASVTVKGKSGQLLRFTWRRSPKPLKLDFDDYLAAGGGASHRFTVTRNRLESRLRDYFGQGVTVTALKPDSISVPFTTGPGYRLPLVVDASVRPSLECVQNGPIRASADSVSVYCVGRLPVGLTQIRTEPIVRSGLKDTLRASVAVVPVPGVRIIPDRVEVTVPIEPLIAKKRMVKVEILNVPPSQAVILFPSEVELSYLVPISNYSDDIGVHVFADYGDIAASRTSSRLPLSMSFAASNVGSAELKPDSVEYIVEHIPLPGQ